MAMAFLKVNAFKPQMQHCRQAGIMVLFSSLGDHDQRVVDRMQALATNMGPTGKIKVKIEKPDEPEFDNVICLLRFERSNNGDWAWQHKMSHCTVGPSGTFGIYQLVEFINGEPYNVAKSEFNSIFPVNMTMPYMFDYERLQELEWNGYTLITPDIAEAMVDRVENIIEERGINLDALTIEQEERIRKQVSREDALTGLLGPSDYSSHGPVVDICHAFWSWVGTMYTLLIELMYTAWEWSIDDIEWVLGHCSLNTVNSQFEYYYKYVNKNRKVNPWFKLMITGDGYKIMLNDFPHVIAAAAWIACENERLRDDGNYIQTLILVVFWVVTKCMRYVFFVLFRFDFSDCERERDGTPKIIEKMIRMCNKATYIAMHICNIMVCLYELGYSLFI